MAWNFRKGGNKTDMTTQVNAVTPSSHPGQADQLTRAQSFIAGEIASFGAAANVSVIAYGHRDATSSTVYIMISPVKLDPNGQVIQ